MPNPKKDITRKKNYRSISFMKDALPDLKLNISILNLAKYKKENRPIGQNIKVRNKSTHM